MTKFLLSACAAALIGAAAVPASAGDPSTSGNGRSGAIIQVDGNRYYDGGRNYGWSYPPYGYGNGWRGDRDRGYGNGWGYGNNHRMVSPRWIVRNLARANYSYITDPMLAGRFYQVKAIDPRGRKVKLYIDAYTGEIAKRKFRS
jgi:hypothetical protein